MDSYRERQYAGSHDHSRWIDDLPEDHYYDSYSNKPVYPNRDSQQNGLGRYFSSPEEEYYDGYGQAQAEQLKSSSTIDSSLLIQTATTSSIDEVSTSTASALESASSFAFSSLSSMPEPLSTTMASFKKQEDQFSDSKDRGEIKATQQHENGHKGAVKKASVNGNNGRDSSTTFHLPPGTNLGLVGKLGAYQVAHKKPVSAASTIASHQFNMLGFYLCIFFVTFFVMKKKY